MDINQAKTHLLTQLAKLDHTDAEPIHLLTTSYSTLVHAEMQEKMTNYGMNHCPACGKHDELDTEEIG